MMKDFISWLIKTVKEDPEAELNAYVVASRLRKALDDELWLLGKTTTTAEGFREYVHQLISLYEDALTELNSPVLEV